MRLELGIRAGRLWRSGRLRVGVLLLGVVAAAAVAAAAGVGADPDEPTSTLLAAPSWSHPFGTDDLGRDVLARVLHGANTGLLIAFGCVLIATVIGLVIGLASGCAGGLLDEMLLKVTELFQVMPLFLLALVAAALFGASPVLIIAVLAAGFWPLTARLARGEARSLREREFVEAARSLGAGTPWILARHLLPSALPPVVANASFQAGTAVLIETGLAFLGLSDRDNVSWGTMLADARPYITVAWWTSLFPGLAIAITVLALNLVGDGMDTTGSPPPGIAGTPRGRRRAGRPRPSARSRPHT